MISNPYWLKAFQSIYLIFVMLRSPIWDYLINSSEMNHSGLLSCHWLLTLRRHLDEAHHIILISVGPLDQGYSDLVVISPLLLCPGVLSSLNPTRLVFVHIGFPCVHVCMCVSACVCAWFQIWALLLLKNTWKISALYSSTALHLQSWQVESGPWQQPAGSRVLAVLYAFDVLIVTPGLLLAVVQQPMTFSSSSSFATSFFFLFDKNQAFCCFAA